MNLSLDHHSHHQWLCTNGDGLVTPKPHSEEDNVPGKFAVHNGNSLFPSAMVYTGGHLYIDPMTQVRFGKPSNYLRFYSQSIGTGAGRGQIQFGYSVGENGPKGLESTLQKQNDSE